MGMRILILPDAARERFGQTEANFGNVFNPTGAIPAGRGSRFGPSPWRSRMARD
jgi:hypothetical protein